MNEVCLVKFSFLGHKAKKVLMCMRKKKKNKLVLLSRVRRTDKDLWGIAGMEKGKGREYQELI